MAPRSTALARRVASPAPSLFRRGAGSSSRLTGELVKLKDKLTRANAAKRDLKDKVATQALDLTKMAATDVGAFAAGALTGAQGNEQIYLLGGKVPLDVAIGAGLAVAGVGLFKPHEFGRAIAHVGNGMIAGRAYMTGYLMTHSGSGTASAPAPEEESE